jgi:hypothetical protein
LDTDKTNVWFWRYGIFQKREEYVVATDYENYALLRGCDRLWWSFGILANERYTYLSRDKYSDFPYIKAAKDYMRFNDKVFYNTVSSWVKSGLSCGFDAAPTHEELMVQVFARQPLWSDYKENSVNTQRVKKMFTGGGDLPWGTLVGDLDLNNGWVDTYSYFKYAIGLCDYQEFIYINNMQLEQGSDKKVDIWMLAVGVPDDELTILKRMMVDSTRDISACCYFEGDN